MKNTGNVICAACLYMQGVGLMIKTRRADWIALSLRDLGWNCKIIMEIGTEGLRNWGHSVENYQCIIISNFL